MKAQRNSSCCTRETKHKKVILKQTF